MVRYRTFEDAFTAACEAQGMKDDKGNLIKATGKPITETEYIEEKTKELRDKLSNMKLQPPARLNNQ